ncbi:hypothetical protein BSL78_27108 [Apostichopus japonicus]|uniref:NACHT domain-containing protein n=1 Tax=Stichopus japonicus TaxID=307972 RepID=A0A2G8JJY6_STIJA|nr:hypothetical protein BSL78_27108 [Apostichopus japonicus]
MEIYKIFLSVAPGGYRNTREPQKSTANNEENVPMVQKTESDALKTFIAQLKLNYENLYCGIKPIPFMQDRCTVHELYVEGGIEYLLKGQTMNHKWERFDSYKNLFTHPQLSGNRWIIEAEPGYGKSTLALQLAYEWCHEVPGSSLCSIDIFLLIRLRQLKDVSSIYEAIKRFILPTNSQFTIDEIKSFIDKCPSLVIILDGFDEYPERNVENSDIFNILQRKMFPDCKVLLTTRSSQLPEEYAAQTNRLRLTGFKSEAQEEYLQKVVTINGYKSFENTIKEWLEENPVLKELCVVPLFFVMYAHLSLQSDALKNCTSMTSFFRYMISCLHSHMKSKFKDENVEKFEMNENNHKQLDELCFAKLNGHSYNPDMDKEDLVQKLGKEFLDQYLTIGILREEKTIVVSNQPGIEASEHVKNVSKIRFYHSLFCEWYAAHHLAGVLDKVNETLDDELREDELEILEDLDPIQLQYVVRFACGIKPTAAKHILDHLKISQEGIEALPILCILEQVGNVDEIMENLREVCSGSLQIRDQDNKIIQRSVIKILELAASRKITIPKVILIESFKRVDTENNAIVLNSEVFVPELCDVSQLSLEHKEMEFSHEILEDIFNYISHCRNLKEIRFLYSLLPYKVDAEPVLRKLSAKNVKGMIFTILKT